MGGFTAPIVCAMRRVDLLVLVNAMIPLPGETFDAWGSNTGSGQARREYHARLGLSPPRPATTPPSTTTTSRQSCGPRRRRGRGRLSR